MKRVALVLILVAMPLLTASMLAENDSPSRSESARATSLTADGAPASPYFNGQWSNGSDFTPDPFYVSSPFAISAKPAGAFSKRREIAGPSNSSRTRLHALNILRATFAPGGVTHSFGYFQPVYERAADQKLVETVTSDVVKLYMVRPASQPHYPSASFTFEWKQNAEAPELHATGHTESAANLRNSAAARAKKARRAPPYRHEPDSETSCFISEDDPRPALQYPVVVVTSLDLAKLGEFRGVEPLQNWSESTQTALREASSRVKNSGVVK